MAPQNPGPSAADSLAELRTIEASLQAHHGTPLAAQRLHPLIRAVEVFGFHLATVDLRQSSDQHERVVAELLAVARIEPDYAALSEEARRAVLLRLLQDARPVRVMGAAYSEHTRSELAIFEAALRMRQRRGARHQTRWLRRESSSVGSARTSASTRPARSRARWVPPRRGSASRPPPPTTTRATPR